MTRPAVLATLAALVGAVALVPGMVVIPDAPPSEPCAGRGSQLLVHSHSKRMWLCEGGHAVEGFRVGLGRGGFGKRIEGDGKTPLGEYPLDAPRTSSRYHLFIPVAYPTARQRAAGFTGGDIGVHGPTFFIRWLPGGATWFNRTRGCIELGSVDEIERVAAWVGTGRVRGIAIE